MEGRLINDSIALRWNPPSDRGDGIQAYVIRYGVVLRTDTIQGILHLATVTRHNVHVCMNILGRFFKKNLSSQVVPNVNNILRDIIVFPCDFIICILQFEYFQHAHTNTRMFVHVFQFRPRYSSPSATRVMSSRSHLTRQRSCLRMCR